MSEVECVKVKIKEGTLAAVREWAALLNGQADEVRNLILAEGVSVESVFLESSSEGSYLIYYIRAKDLRRAKEIARQSQHSIDIFHRETMQKIFDGSVPLERLIDFESK